MYQFFTDLPVWKVANDISVEVFKISSLLPTQEDYGLTSQIRRSSNSIGANIAEGFGRKHKKDKMNFYIYSRGSAYETIHHLIYGSKVGYFEEQKVKNLIRKLEELIYEINKVIKTVESWKSKS
ncbi:four helix bundle protein [Orenia metallireducens]|jgi:four helix bundle protein|uniref:Four helix bundle protein n=1 Tax=Orenia metallireducens TaxID=1413210 RepID=A0A285FVW2_9FIRM|nr:four helix bundle protein [Orenia metallireducens]PRX35663.1 four helix bundle protein [Orenia metallireducens]SNY15419.1 four helix bundle protein [Orenia metallireducens]